MNSEQENNTKCPQCRKYKEVILLLQKELKEFKAARKNFSHPAEELFDNKQKEIQLPDGIENKDVLIPIDNYYNPKECIKCSKKDVYVTEHPDPDDPDGTVFAHKECLPEAIPKKNQEEISSADPEPHV